MPRLSAPSAGLLRELAAEARIVGWSEGVHNRAQYLVARNAAIRELVESRAIRVIAAETNFALSRPVDSYLRGLGSAKPSASVVRGVWSWGRTPLRDNLRLLRWLRRHNARLGRRDQVRFYGLDMYGSGTEDPVDALALLTDADDARHGRSLLQALAEHRAGGGDHRDISARDAAQYASLDEVARRHPSDRILLFEQVEHLDRRIPGSLAERLARGSLGPVRLVGSLWRDGEPAVRYPLGPSLELSRWMTSHRSRLLPVSAGTEMLDLRPWQTENRDEVGTLDAPEGPLAVAAAAFDAMLYAHALLPAAPACDEENASP